jgi:SAM-dependent methyltransferase
MEAHLYNELARQEDTHWWFQGRRAVLRSVLERHLPPPPRRILDVGCGTGGNLRLLCEFGEAEGLELSDVALELCRERVGPEVKLRRGGIPAGIPQDGQYDALTAFDVLEHLDDPVAAVAAMRGALRFGGTLICSVPAFAFLWSAHDDVHHHRRRYTQALLKTHLEAGGLRVRWSSYFNTLLFAPIAAARAVGRLRRGAGGARGSDLGHVPRPLNSALAALFASERHVIPRARLPVGVSLVAVADAVDTRS